MEILIYFFIFLFGLMVGSFLNCVIYRLETGGNFLKGKSFCPQCKHLLAWPDLIPVFSFLILGGKCRYCHQKISWQYPLVEFATALIFLLIFLTSNLNNYTYVYLLVMSCFLIIVFVYDLKYYLIPDKIIYPAIAITILYQLFRIWNFGLWDLVGIWHLAFGILPSFFFLGIILLSRGQWMGFGDFKLAILMGLFLGWPKILISLYFSFLIGGIIGIILVLLKKKTLKSEIPFGPFLVSGTFFAIFFGERLLTFFQLFG